jgi:MFS family permease
LAVRLSILMFLQFGVLGAWLPIFGPYLNSLEIDKLDIAWIWSANALGSLLAPLPWSQIADRWLAADRCITLCAAVPGTALWVVADLREPLPLFWATFTFWMFMMPVLSLAPSLTFRHITHPERQYSRIRLWGTVGWMAAGWALTAWFETPRLFGYGTVADPADALRWGAILAWTLSIYAWTLPATPPLARAAQPRSALGWLHRWIDSPLQAVQLFRYPSFVLYMVCFFGCYLSWPFNLQMTSLLVQEVGVPLRWLPWVVSLAQSSEAVLLALLPHVLSRLGQKRTMTLGIGCWATALIVLSLGRPAALVVGSLVLHGFFITCFLVAGQVFVNRIARHEFRASAQGMLVLITGLGLLIGNLLVGELRERFEENYPLVFLPAAIGVTSLAILFTAGFRPPPPNEPQAPISR